MNKQKKKLKIVLNEMQFIKSKKYCYYYLFDAQIQRLDELNDREEDDAEKQHQITESKYKAIEDGIYYYH